MVAIEYRKPSFADSPVLHWHIESSAAALGRMRQELGVALDLCHVSGDAVEAAMLVAYELATNAAEHVGSAVDVVASVHREVIRIGVSDASPDAPQLQRPNRRAVRGRGLQMVNGLSSRWYWRCGPRGKTVWAEVPLTRAA